MSAFSDYAEKMVLDHLFGGQTFTAPSNYYLALFTATPNDSGGGTEVSGGSYARATVDNDTSMFAGATSGTGKTTNNEEITFPEATGSWGTVTHWALFDAVSGGNMILYGALDNSKTITSGDTPKVAVGTLEISLA